MLLVYIVNNCQVAIIYIKKTISIDSSSSTSGCCHPLCPV